MVASSIFETLSLRFMFCLSIVYVYKERFNFVYVSSGANNFAQIIVNVRFRFICKKRLVPLVYHNAALIEGCLCRTLVLSLSNDARQGEH
ncbi:hypothetical protein E2986_13023 [Frieseomelitta varia]|uniref:Uncharacterized protein n=1 Tax=Frieseomelitta varia TaxID=561572 RepID=A0A833W0J0_9HYME|nr:hypothetical protein E2986_13023 [Frieseomelitta varia]